MKLGWGAEGPDEAEEACVDSLASSVIIPAPSVPQEWPRSSGCLSTCCALNYTRPSHTRSLSSRSQSFINPSIFFSSHLFVCFMCHPNWSQADDSPMESGSALGFLPQWRFSWPLLDLASSGGPGGLPSDCTKRFETTVDRRMMLKDSD